MNDPDRTPDGLSWEASLARTRAAVLNVLVAVAVMIALCGWLLRRRAEDAIARAPRGLHDALLFALLVVAVASYLARRSRPRRASSVTPGRREVQFFRSHVAGAAIAALGVPLGLAYGWWVDPRLEGVIPFWVIPLALGFLAIPRRLELLEWDAASSQSGESSL
jgi:hypothetical protein